MTETDIVIAFGTVTDEQCAPLIKGMLQRNMSPIIVHVDTQQKYHEIGCILGTAQDRTNKQKLSDKQFPKAYIRHQRRIVRELMRPLREVSLKDVKALVLPYPPIKYQRGWDDWGDWDWITRCFKNLQAGYRVREYEAQPGRYWLDDCRMGQCLPLIEDEEL